MNVSRITNLILTNNMFLKSLEKISEHGTSFSAGASLLLSLSLRPFAINSAPNVEKENKQYAIANSICSGLIKFGIIESVALPVETAIKKIDSHKQAFLRTQTIESLSPRAYKLITQTLKLSSGFITAIPKSMLTIALIPIVMDKLFKIKKQEKIYSPKPLQQVSFEHFEKGLTFTGNFIPKQISKIINNKRIQKLALKYESKDNDIPKHISAGTDILLTSAFAYNTNKSKEIKENRKKVLIYNNLISTAFTLIGGYFVDSLIKPHSNKLSEKLKELNPNNPKILKSVEGLNILRPAIIFAFIYYGILPIFSTYIAERIDKAVNKNSNQP